MSEDKHITGFGQLQVYVGKCFRAFKSEKHWKNFVSTFIIIVLISFVTGAEMFTDYAATKKGTFAIVCACIWVGLFNSIQSICKERGIIKREHRSGVKISSYLGAHAVYEAFLSAVEALIILVVTYVRNITHPPMSGGLVTVSIIDMYITLFLIVYASDITALLISSIVKTEAAAMTVMPFVLIIELIMSGTLFDLSGITKLISHLTISKWGQFALCSIAHVDQMSRWGGVDEGMESITAYVLRDWLLLLIFTVVCFAGAIVALSQVDKDKRQ